jgi:hypothetical protein
MVGSGENLGTEEKLDPTQFYPPQIRQGCPALGSNRPTNRMSYGLTTSKIEFRVEGTYSSLWVCEYANGMCIALWCQLQHRVEGTYSSLWVCEYANGMCIA